MTPSVRALGRVVALLFAVQVLAAFTLVDRPDGSDRLAAAGGRPPISSKSTTDAADAPATATPLPAPADPGTVDAALSEGADDYPSLALGARPAERPSSGTSGRAAPAAVPPGPKPSTPSPTAGWTPGPAAAKQWAVIVGVGKYQGRTKPTRGGDAAAFKEVLRRSGWAADHVKVLVDGGATASAMRAAMRWLVERSGPDTFTVFHYSGHVRQASGHEYLWSHDNVFIPDDEFSGVMRQLRGQAWIDIAGCEANGFDHGISSPSRLYTASSQTHEKSYEMPDWNRSVWAGLLLDRALMDGRGDADGDRRVSIQEAARQARQQAPVITRGQRHGAQHPQISGGVADGWFLDGKGTVAEAPPPPSPSPSPPPTQPPKPPCAPVPGTPSCPV